MPWRAPDNFGSMTFKGLTIEADKWGEVDLASFPPDVAAGLAPDLISHGFIAVEAPTRVSNLLVAPLDESDNPGLPGLSAALDLQDTVASKTTDKPEVEVTDPEATDSVEDEPDVVNPNAVDEFHTMKRSAMFAWLFDHGVTVSSPINNHDLRAACRAKAAQVSAKPAS